jgi:hypothetical protein
MIKRLGLLECLGSGPAAASAAAGGGLLPVPVRHQRRRPRYRVIRPNIGKPRYRYILILTTYRRRCHLKLPPISVYSDIVCNIWYISEPMSAKNPISVVARNGYTPILRRYRCNISPDIVFFADIGEKTRDIGGGKKRVYADIDRCHIGADIGVNLPISADIVYKNADIGWCPFFGPDICYRVLVYRH